MKITLNNKEEQKAFRIFLIFIVLEMLFILFNTRCNAQSTKTIYRQTLIIKSGKPIEIITWQKITVNYLDVIYQYNSKLTKRRKVLIVFGINEGTSPLSDWVKYDIKEGDTIYNYKRSL